MLPFIWILHLSCVTVAIQRIPGAGFFIYARPVKHAKDGVAPRRQRAASGGVAAARCLCFIPRSLARSSVRLDRNAVKWTRPTSNDVPFTERPETHGRRLQEVRRKYALKLMQLILSRWLRVSHTHARARTHTHLKHTYCVLPWKSCIQCTVTQLTQENRVGELIVKVNM